MYSYFGDEQLANYVNSKEIWNLDTEKKEKGFNPYSTDTRRARQSALFGNLPSWPRANLKP